MQKRLYEAFDFNANDVTANRHGRLSDDQMHYLKKVRTAAGAIALLMLLPVLTLGLWAATAGGSAITLILLAYLLVAVPLVVLPNLVMLNRLRNLAAVEIHSIEGELEVSPRVDMGSRYFIFSIETRQFKVARQLGKVLQEQPRYRVYYLAGFRAPLTLEVVE